LIDLSVLNIPTWSVPDGEPVLCNFKVIVSIDLPTREDVGETYSVWIGLPALVEIPKLSVVSLMYVIGPEVVMVYSDVEMLPELPAVSFAKYFSVVVELIEIGEE
jgi:hypothetical protein